MCPFMLSINMIPKLVAYTIKCGPFHVIDKYDTEAGRIYGQMCPFMLSVYTIKYVIDKYDTDAGRIYGQMCPFMLSINMIPTLVAYTIKCALSCYR